MKKAAVSTLGCKVNMVESSSITQQLIKHNYQIVEFNQIADIYIINTCTVTNRTDYKSRSKIRHALSIKKKHSHVKVIVTGCYSQKSKDEVLSLGNIDLIVDNQSKIDINQWLNNQDYSFRDIMEVHDFNWMKVDSMHEKTRAFIKIQDGCNYFCSYCAVPFGRGKPRSMSFNNVVDQVKTLSENGYKEFVLTGINLGLYKDIESKQNLADLIKVLDNLEYVILLRLSSIEPDLWSTYIYQTIDGCKTISPHFHIPVQSGSNNILKKMNRRYDKNRVRDVVKTLIRIKPYCAIGFDVMCGFPGEKEADFEETVEFIEDLPITYLHVFGYSIRNGTYAATMPELVNGKVIKNRVNRLIKLSIRKKQEYINKLISKKVILRGVVDKVENGIGSALSDHYVRMYINDTSVNQNQLLKSIALKRYKDGALI